MPIPAKLKAPLVELDLMEVRLNFMVYGTKCEVGSCRQPADNYLQTHWSFIWICADDYAAVVSMTVMNRGQWERGMAEQMYERMLVFNYIHQNLDSDFELAARITEREAVVKAIDAEEKNRRTNEQRELRKAIKNADARVGAPDDELLVARQRQADRVQAGAKPLGKPRIDRVVLLKPKLIVSLNGLIKDPQEK